ncbi:uncharacterized protein LOC131852001 [Achroia grisella]|uniref:uncharacterized protein LOC131852001 n=1 Tax=Achroia grisella TaxID=688607 RepID=UPI0027D296B9|nr:uncharacterized protein LOC131852001 [Achroia grisella]
MSDRITDLLKGYEENVLDVQQPRSIGLFTIPEYPEYEAKRGMLSAALEVILTTLRYLAPATLLTLFWGQQSFLFKLLKNIDSAFRAIVFSSEDQKQAVVQWLDEVGPVRVEALDTVWRHGWIVCGVLDSAMPGACAGHPPVRISLAHAQGIAHHYLGVEPVFSRQELESNGSLSKHQEWKLATYLDRIRQALEKLTPPVSKPVSQRTPLEIIQFSMDYVARGSGLSAAQVNNKMHFKIYPTGQQSLDPKEITVLIKGPKDTYGMTVLPPIFGKAQLIRQKLLGLQNKQNFTESVLPITQGATYLRAFGKNDMNKTYYIPKTKYEIEIEKDLHSDHAKISYVVKREGRYEISITSRGQNIVGSPFSMTASHNIIGILERESFCLEDGEEIDIVDVKTDRKVVLRIVDFVTEKMLLKENGSLEKITDNEAKKLMTENLRLSADESILKKHNENGINEISSNSSNDKYNDIRKFQRAVRKIIITSRVCKAFVDNIRKQQTFTTNKENSNNEPRSKQDIPDIVNSTLIDTTMKPYHISDSRDKIIIPETISVSILTEKHKTNYDASTIPKDPKIYSQVNYDDARDSLEEYCLIQNYNDDNSQDDTQDDITNSASNPFINEIFQHDYKTEKELCSFVANEYERNNSQCEETDNTLIKILIDENNETSTTNNNPFIDADIINLTRPKSPVFKIISGEVRNHDDPGYIDTEVEIAKQVGDNEFINPFFIHQHRESSDYKESLPITAFKIGAPVSLPPIIRATSPVPEMDSLIITSSEEIKTDVNINNNELSIFTTPVDTNQIKKDEDSNLSICSTFQSLDSEMADSSYASKNNSKLENYQIETTHLSQNDTPKKDTWDSAYVSIDDNNSSPDSNNNDNAPITELVGKQKSSPSDVSYEVKRVQLSNMGPAEREIWQTCSELKNDVFVVHEDHNIKPSKFEPKRPIFTPIIEENDRSIPSGIKDIKQIDAIEKRSETDAVTVAFAELNDLYQEYFPNTESSCTKSLNENHQFQTAKQKKEYTVDTIYVNSASEIGTDVKRQPKDMEGKISEVQASVTESISASQTLQSNKVQNEYKLTNKDEIQFGDRKHTNLVLERKKYWDERIRQIEAKSEESTTFQKKRRLSSKHLRNNDSLTKRRGKQIVKNFLKADESRNDNGNSFLNKSSVDIDTKTEEITDSQKPTQQVKSNIKLVNKWKTFWDNKLDTNLENNTICSLETKPLKSKQPLKLNNKNIDKENYCEPKSSSPGKQELPEEVFKAFETSPKRFFGTSRKQILNKIDTFLGKPSTTDRSSADVTGASQDSGLVSSRISLFHKISNTEDLSWSNRKSQSMHNIHQNKNNYRNESSSELTLKTVTNIDNNTLESGKHEDFEKLDSNEDITDIKSTLNRTHSIETSLPNRTLKMAPSSWNNCFNESNIVKESDPIKKESIYVKNIIKQMKQINKDNQEENKYKKLNDLCRTSISKSEMDIFNKTSHEYDDDFDKYKSCDELPKINVKNFISLYESASNTAPKPILARKHSKVNIQNSQKQLYSIKSISVNVINRPNSSLQESYQENSSYKSFESVSIDSADTKTSNSYELEPSNRDKETTYISLSDIELEIVESPNKSIEPSPERDMDSVKKDYKSRFKMAKEFFQSLEEIRDVKKPTKISECQQLLQSKSSESPENKRLQKRIKKKLKSHSMPSSEIAKIWNDMQENENKESSKLMKISEKFNVEDLFSDVMDGKLSRQGSLRGIPHKKAVLETFRSMENITDRTISPYEIAVTEISDLADGNHVKSAQTYLSEYPYLPTTEPSKSHSRLDAKASGLITLKELKTKKPRRNSVPDLRLNASFTADL